MTSPEYGKRIVVGVDGSEGSTTALAWALDEAGHTDLPVEAVFVWSRAIELEGGEVVPLPFAADVEATGKSVLQTCLDAVPGHERAAVALTVRVGDPVDTLRAEGSDPDTALLVVGSRGHGGLAGLLLGSVSQSLTHRPSRPLVIVPDRRARRAEDEEAAAPTGGHRIVVGIDGSDASFEALRWAVAEARSRGASVVAVHTFGLPGPTAFPFGPSEAGMRKLRDAAEHALRATVLRLGPHAGIEIEERVVHGAPAAVLVEEAAHADLLVLGSSGRGRASEVLFGSTVHGCAHRSSVPLVLVPAAGEDR